MMIVGFSAAFLGILALLSRIENILLKKIVAGFFICSACFYFAADLISMHWTGQHVKWGYIKTILQPGFIRQSGITSATLYTGSLILGFSVLLGILFTVFLRMKRTHGLAILVLIFLSFTGFYFSPSKNAESEIYFPHLESREIPSDFKIEDIAASKLKIPYVFIIVGESMRAEFATKEYMPQFSELEGTLYPKNFSTANATHFGIFTILSGVFPHFYENAVTRNWEVPFLSWMKKSGYETTALNSDSFSWMGLDKIIGKQNFHQVVEIKDEDRSVSDRLVLERVKKAVKETNLPQFFFIKLNSTHHNYYYPKEFEFYKPVIPLDFDFILNSPADHIDRIMNRYLNSVRYFDFLLGDFVGFLKQQNIWDKSLVVIVTDHGEEFYENGTYAHSTGLNYFQNSALLFIHRPQDQNRETSKIQSSHLDIVPTVMESLGGKKPEWMDGLNLFSPHIPTNRVVFSAWHSGLKIGAVSFNRDKAVFSELSYEKTPEDQKLIDEGLPYYHQFFLNH